MKNARKSKCELTFLSGQSLLNPQGQSQLIDTYVLKLHLNVIDKESMPSFHNLEKFYMDLGFSFDRRAVIARLLSFHLNTV